MPPEVSVSNHQGATSENILSAVEETLKTMAHAGTNYLTKSTNMLRNVKKKKKKSEKVKRILPGTKIAFSNTLSAKKSRGKVIKFFTSD